MRFFIELSYKGTNYHGWQEQPNANTVQAEINRALSTILNTNIEVIGAGRTDTGVHANQMFAHFDCDIDFDIQNLMFKLNSFLASDIAIYAGADFIKTSTGKISPAATMPVTFVMLNAIKDYYKKTGIKKI